MPALPLGGLAQGATRRRIQAAHVLVHPSRTEGDAHVVIEAARSSTPVLASRVDGNLGLPGENCDGYIAVDDASAFATLLRRLRDQSAMLSHPQRQCAERAPLFDPTQESAALHALFQEMLDTRRPLTTRDTP
jgi:glycosyltransferase involved in cell wall biosynthesis